MTSSWAPLHETAVALAMPHGHSRVFLLAAGFLHDAGVLLDGQSVTLEPGGQFELSGAPVESIHLTCAEVNSHLYQVGCIAMAVGRPVVDWETMLTSHRPSRARACHQTSTLCRSPLLMPLSGQGHWGGAGHWVPGGRL